MKCERDLFKKKKIKTMMAKHTYLSTIEPKKQTKQTRTTETKSRYGEQLDGCQISRECKGMGEEVRGLRSIKR